MSNYPKKLIEVALPLEDINAASAREKSIRHGHPSTLHLWWARRPLAAARAVLFSQLVDDPSGYADELTKDPRSVKAAEKTLGRKHRGDGDLAIEGLLVEAERERLFDLIRELVIWENINNESVIERARQEILKSWQRSCKREGESENTPMPPFLDPFAGGGAIPLEAQRLGLESHASDLNPLAVLINKAMIEIPPKFSNLPPVYPASQKGLGESGWKGAAGLAEDVRYYGNWMHEEAFKRIGHLYPPYTLTKEIVDSRPDLLSAGHRAGDKLTVIAWLWARTVPSPNPALAGKLVPLVSSFFLSTRSKKEAWIQPIVEDGEYHFTVRMGPPDDLETTKAGTKSGRGNYSCLLSGVPIDAKYIREAGKTGKLGARLMAVVAEGKNKRVYLPPCKEHEQAAVAESPSAAPTTNLPEKALGFRVQGYGMTRHAQLFSDRQLIALNQFSDLVKEVASEVLSISSRPDYEKAVAVYLAFAVDKLVNYSSSLCTWHQSRETVVSTFGLPTLSMTWDYTETNPFSGSSGNWSVGVTQAAKVLDKLSANNTGYATQADAGNLTMENGSKIISTDPPYYDNIPYADLSDVLYVWTRKTLKDLFPELLGTLLVPKEQELIAEPSRHGGAEKAKKFFEAGLEKVFKSLWHMGSTSFPMTVFYAFKQQESKGGSATSSIGWETFLEGLMRAGWEIDATWPIRTEQPGGLRLAGRNSLASSILLVCRQRVAESPIATRREFVQVLQRELPTALRNLQHGNVAPVDLPQSSIGPGMAIFSRYSKVMEGDGSSMTVRTALQLINSEVSNILEGQVADMDDWTRFAVTWFASNGFEIGTFGDANIIATAFGVAVNGVAQAGIVESGQGKVRIFRPSELPNDWNPDDDERLTVWEIVHHLIRLLETQGEEAAAAIFTRDAIEAGNTAENARSLCYRLYTICEQNKWAEDATSYNGLISAWPELLKLSQTSPASYIQGDLI